MTRYIFSRFDSNTSVLLPFEVDADAGVPSSLCSTDAADCAFGLSGVTWFAAAFPLVDAVDAGLVSSFENFSDTLLFVFVHLIALVGAKNDSSEDCFGMVK